MLGFTQNLLTMSIKTSVLIFIILFVKYLFNRFFTVKTHYFIWFLLFISLTVPYAPQSTVSIYNIPKYIFYSESILDGSIYDESISSINNQAQTNNEPSDTVSYKNNLSENNNSDGTGEKSITDSKPNSILQFIKNLYSSKVLGYYFAYIWLIGFLLLSFFAVLRSIQLHKLINKEQKILDTNQVSLLQKCKSDFCIKKDITLIKTKEFSTPSLFGVIYPKILLPENLIQEFDDEKLKYILLHELAHVKRKDLLINLFILIYQLIYWFNPIIWIGFRKMKSDMEVACDAFVLEHLEKEKHISYGRVIIDLLEYISCNRFIPISMNMIEHKSEVKRRIIMIKKFKKSPFVLTITSFLLIGAVGCSSISGPEASVQQQNIQEVSSMQKESSISLEDAEKILDDNIIGKDYTYIWNIIGTPYEKTYYINTTGLAEEEILKNISSEAIYPIESKEESSALYVFMENDEIVDIKIDEFSGSPSNMWKNTDYKVNTYSYQSGSSFDVKDFPKIEEDSGIDELRTKYIDKSLDDFKKEFNLDTPNVEVFEKDGDLQLSVYPIVSKDNAAPQGGIYILSEQNIIKSIKIDRTDIDFNKLDELFSLTSDNN